MRVHSVLGPGFLEQSYGDALALEFGKRSLSYDRELRIPVFYEGIPLGGHRRADFVCEGILLELKALPALAPPHVAQLAHYLRATQTPLGLVLNFGARSLEYRRVIMNVGTQLGANRTQGKPESETSEANPRHPSQVRAAV